MCGNGLRANLLVADALGLLVDALRRGGCGKNKGKLVPFYMRKLLREGFY